MRVVATAGHVDHGKSTLVEALTGVHPDRWAEEQRRGMTIDLGFAAVTLPDGEELAFVDVPGHVRYLSNMLAGVGAVDACLFVVAATEGWKPQSEEHLRILDLMGVAHGVVAVTMSDRVDEDALALVELEVSERVAGTFLADAPTVAVSAVTGAGMDRLVAALGQLARTTPAAIDRQRPRLWIDRSFTARGSGTIVTGTLTGGTLAVGDDLAVEPAGTRARVRAIESHHRPLTVAGPGRRVAVNLTGVHHRAVHRGDALVRPRQWARCGTVDATLTALASLTHDVTRRGAYTVHVGSAELPATVRVLGAERIAPGATGCVRLHLPAELPLVRGDRYVLRESGRDETVGGGTMLDVRPVLPASRARPDGDTERVIREHGTITPMLLAQLTGERRDPNAGAYVIHPARLAELSDALRSRVDAHGGRLPIGDVDDVVQAVAAVTSGLSVRHGTITRADAADPLAAHPFVDQLRRAGMNPPSADGIDRAVVRELVTRGLIVERDGVCFHPDTIDHAARAVAGALRTRPEGMTAGELRDVLGTTRKFALPMLGELDRRRITLRRGDRRIAGPNLPAT